MFKLFIFAVFLYVIYRLLTGSIRKKTADNHRPEPEKNEISAHDQLVEDPVCHIYIPKKQAFVLQDKETSVFFCSEHCRKMYCDAHGLENS